MTITLHSLAACAVQGSGAARSEAEPASTGVGLEKIS